MTDSATPAIDTDQDSDRWLLLITLALVGAGLVMVLSASQAIAYVGHRSSFYYFFRQAVFAAIGLAAMAGLSRIDYHRLRPLAPLAALAAIGLMVVVLMPGLGITVNGARRWFNLGPLGSFQPSETGKLILCLYMAHWVDKRRDRIKSLADGLLPFVLLLGAALVLLMLQRDLGTALVMTAILISVYWAGGGPKRHLVLLLSLLALGFIALTAAESYRAARLVSFLDPFKDPLGTGFQSSQALIALGSGGLTGVGLGHSVQKFFWLPEAHTDFIFAIVGEETGLAGTTIMLAGFVCFAWRGYRAAMRAPDRFGVMVAAGLTTWIAAQALINMGTVTDTLPITGVPLPFVSYGGTSLAITMAAAGVLLNVASQGGHQAFARRRIDATFDSRRRDRRPPVASTRRRASVPR